MPTDGPSRRRRRDLGVPMDWPLLVKFGLVCFTAAYWSALFATWLDRFLKGQK